MSNIVRINGIVEESIVDGNGIRYTIFTQGCPHNCFGCHNPSSHDFNLGVDKSVDDIFNEALSNPLLSGVTLSGGEPFCQAEPLALLSKCVREAGLNLIAYTGYTFERLQRMNNPAIQDLISQVDILIDGLFDINQKDLTLSFRGSRNQRVIDVQQSLKCGVIVLANNY